AADAEPLGQPGEQQQCGGQQAGTAVGGGHGDEQAAQGGDGHRQHHRALPSGAVGEPAEEDPAEGRITNPAAKTPRVASIADTGSAGLKNWLAKNGAKIAVALPA